MMMMTLPMMPMLLTVVAAGDCGHISGDDEI